MMALAGVEPETLVSEPDALTLVLTTPQTTPATLALSSTYLKIECSAGVKEFRWQQHSPST